MGLKQGDLLNPWQSAKNVIPIVAPSGLGQHAEPHPYCMIIISSHNYDNIDNNNNNVDDNNTISIERKF